MSKRIARRFGSAVAAVATAAGLAAAGAPAAQAYGPPPPETYAWHTVTMSRAEVRDKEALMHGTGLACHALPKGWSNVCGFVVSRDQIKQRFENAATKGCGLTLKWRATGSNNSWDKAEYRWTENC